MLPRKLQQGYPGMNAANASSCDDTPTKRRPSCTVADWVMIAAGWVSTVVDQSSAPLVLSKASILPPPPNGPCVPTITLLPFNTGVVRALSPGTPLAAGMLARQRCWPVERSTAQRL